MQLPGKTYPTILYVYGKLPEDAAPTVHAATETYPRHKIIVQQIAARKQHTLTVKQRTNTTPAFSWPANDQNSHNADRRHSNSTPSTPAVWLQRVLGGKWESRMRYQDECIVRSVDTVYYDLRLAQLVKRMPCSHISYIISKIGRITYGLYNVK